MDSIDADQRSAESADSVDPFPADTHPSPSTPEAPTTESGAADAPAIPLTAAQRGMWFAENLSPDYSVIVAHYLDITDDPGSSLDVERFARIVRDTAWDLQSAFTRIIEVDGVPMQVVDPSIDFRVRIVDLRDEPDPETAAQAWMSADYQRAVDLRTEPLVVSSLLRIADDRVFWYLRGHHIAIDGFAALNSVQEALARYSAELTGTEPPRKPRADLAELVADDEAYTRSTRRDSDREHWAERAANLPERASLADTSVIAGLTPVNVVAGERLDEQRQQRIDDAATQLGTSPAVLLTAAFTAYLARMTGTDDTVLSLPVTGRATARVKRASGMVSNMLPIVAHDVGAQSTADLVRQVQLEMTGALRHQRYRFEDIRVDAGMRESNTASFGPIVNMMFFDKPLEIAGGRVDYHILSSGILEDLRINLYRAGPGERLVVDLHGNPGLYRHDELERHLRRFLTLLDRLLADTDVPVGQVDLLFADEAAELTALGAGPTVAPRDGDHLLDAFEAQVHRTPDAVAVEDGERSWTYAEFDTLRSELAGRLRADGIRPGDRVVVSLPRGIDQVCAVYAILTAGAAYVPVEPDQPARRRALIAYTVGAEVVVDADYVARAAARPASESFDGLSTRQAGGALPAYVIFTSGSTGTPKGVEVDHHAILNRLAWMQDDHAIDATDAVLYKTPITFDVSVWELFWPLQTGARMVIARPDGHRDPDYLAGLIAAAGVTTLHFVPSMLDTFLDVRAHAVGAQARSGGTGGDTSIFGASVRRVFSSGEALSRGLAEKVAAAGDVELINLYGPTEAAVDVTSHQVVAGAGAVPIGRPVANTAAHVLDPRLRPVPVGVAGELYLTGAQLARGYVGQPDLTADRFVADPYGAPGARMYRTGDMVRWHAADGGATELEYLGRTDFQIKIRGQRVELGEIESVIGELPQAGAVAVVARTEAGAPSLVAYVRADTPDSPETADAQALTPQTVLAACRRHLPSHMVPSAVMILDEFPVNSAGKLDRAALPEPAPMAEAAFAAPTSQTETILARLIGELLDRDRIGLHDNLFAIGGDSLMAARLVSRARIDHGLTLRLADVFDSADIAEMAARAVPESAESLPALHAGLAGSGPDPIPLSHAQTRLWFVNRMDPASATYNMPGAVRLGTDVDLDAMRAAVRDVVERHETLRTRYPSVEGEPVQEILPTDALDASFDAPVRRVDGSMSDAVAAEAAAGFDLVDEVGFRWALLADAEGYVAVMVLHHIAADGFSLAPLMRDLLWAYASRRRGEEPAWPPLPIRYADFASWQHQMLGSTDEPTPLQATESDFWADELAGLPELLNLPTDRPRPAVATGHGGYVDLSVDSELVSGIHALARTAAVTPFTVVHAALATVLGRRADTDDVAIGTAVAGRDDPQTADLVGMFVNTVVLRTRVPASATTRELLVDAHQARSRALAHAHLPFERVVDIVSPQRSSAYAPLFQVALTMLKSDAQGTGVTRDAMIDARVPSAKYDLAVTMIERPHLSDTDADIEISYATDLFDQSTVAAIGEEVLAALRAMVADPDGYIARTDLLTPDRVAALTRRPLSPVMPESFRDLLAAGAARADHSAPALVGPDSTVTWAVFDARTNQLARELIDRGVGPGSLVAVSIPRSVYSVYAIVAVIKTGAAFVNVDPRHPAARRTDMVTDVEPVLGLTTAELAGDTVGEFEWLAVDDEAVELRLAGHSGARILNRELTATPSLGDLAYLIFTSGSTGRPKATAVSHDGLANLVNNQVRLLGLDTGSRVLHVASPSFDLSIFEMIMGLCAGGRLVISPVDVYADTELERVIADGGVTHAIMTPSALGTLDPAALPTLRVVGSAGEACPPELIHRFATGDRAFFNLYGPTEITIWATVAGPMRPGEPVTIGPALPGMGTLVLDRMLRPVPDGVPGELYLTGIQVARGYHGRSGLTSTRFVANPFGDGGARMYRTGDRVSRSAGGELIYHGRTDFQLKIRGQRVEPGELDAVLMDHPEITNAISVGVSGPAGETVLVSYVTVVDGSSVAPEAIIDHAADQVPAHLLPHTVMIVDAFGLTPVGKIDREALPAVDFSMSTEFVAPRTEMEVIVADVFAEVLGLSAVSVHDGFFTLGGNSLSATKVTSRLSALLDRAVSVKDLFEKPSVAAFAAHLTTSVAGRSAPALTARSRAAMVPVSGLQRGMWLLNRADPDSANYNVALALRMTGELDTVALRAAIADLVTRHESLRTTYPMVNGTPVQVIVPVTDLIDDLNLQVTDIDGDPRAAIARVTGEGFDVVAGPPLRVAVLRTGVDDHILVFVVHHISADGSSMAPLARDLMTAYAARHQGTAPTWTPLPVQYADFALWQAEKLGATDDDGVTEEQRQLHYWRDRLSGAPEQIELPADRARPRTPSFAGAVVDFRLPVELVRGLEAVARTSNTTLFMVTHAAFAVLATRITGRGDVVIGTPYAGRGDAALDDVVGMFVNTLPLRTRVDVGETFAALLDRVRTDDLMDMAHADVAFESIVSEVLDATPTSFNPLFQLMFAFQNIDFPTLELAGLTIAPEDEQLVSAKVDLQLTLFPQDPSGTTDDGAIKGQLLYSTDLFDERSVRRFADWYVRVLEAIVAEPSCVVGDIALQTIAAVGEAATATTPPPSRPLPELVTAAAGVDATAVAVEQGDFVMSFGDLDAMCSAMSAALPAEDPDSALTMALMSSVPDLAASGPDALDAVLGELRRSATAVAGERSTGNDSSDAVVVKGPGRP